MELIVSLPEYPAILGGLGCHNSEAGMYRLMSDDFFNQMVCKCYREISPGFMRCFGGFSDWTKPVMDDFADYYEQMQKWTDTPIYMVPGRGRILFSDEEIKDYSQNVAQRLSYLIRERNVRHLTYYCFSNELAAVEPARLTNDLSQFKRLHEALYQSFQNAGLNVGLLATDEPNWWESIYWAQRNMDPITKDYCGHYYESEYSLEDTHFYDFWFRRCRTFVNAASRCQKHFIIGEYGLTQPTNGPVGAVAKDTCSYYETGETAVSCLKHADMIIGAVNAGVFAMAYWTFMDYPAPFNGPSFRDEYSTQWTKYEPFLGGGINHRYNRHGLLRFEDNANPTPRENYWCIGLIMKYLKRNAMILSTDDCGDLLHSCAIMNRDKSISIVVSNRQKAPTKLSIRVPFHRSPSEKLFRVYQYDVHNPPYNRFGDLTTPYEAVPCDNGVISISLPPESVLIITNDYIEKSIPVQAEIVSCKDGRLSWKAVNDKKHCYYRVFRVDSANEQICSTIAQTCTVPIGGEYKVYSVDTSGNI